ncbi:hypothetical protein J3F83DRAFT_747091 [Trichoderma novae-zelandiae]
MVSGIIYKGVPHVYGSSCDIANVMLTRHRCGLVVVGDINVTGELVEVEVEGKGKGKGKGKSKRNDSSFRVEGPNGEMYFTKASALRRVHEKLHSAGRVIIIPVTKKEKAAGTAEVVEAGPAPAE